MAFIILLIFGLNFYASIAAAEGNSLVGRAIAHKHCSRCHVVGDFNKYGGIGSTPSFQVILGMKDGLHRFETFFQRRPHPVFVRVPGVPRWSKVPSYATEFVVSGENLGDLLAFIKTIKKKDLGGIPILGKFKQK